MKHGTRTRLMAVTALFMLSLQFPIAEVSVPIRYQDSTETLVPISVMQVAVASYMQGGSKLPPAFLKAFLAPGIVAHDLFHDIQCRTGMDTRACEVPKAMPQYADAFNLTQPLCNPKIIMGIVKRNFPKSTELIQAGSTVTVGSALFSILYPIKIGFFGYLMIMFALFQEGITPFIPGLAFLPIFAIATDIGSLFRQPWERKEPVKDAASEPAQKGTKAVAASADVKEKKEKAGNRKKKR